MEELNNSIWVLHRAGGHTVIHLFRGFCWFLLRSAAGEDEYSLPFFNHNLAE